MSSLLNSLGFGSAPAEENADSPENSNSEDEAVLVETSEAEAVSDPHNTALDSSNLESNDTGLENSDSVNMSPPLEDFSAYNDAMLVNLMTANDDALFKRKLQMRKTSDQDEKMHVKKKLTVLRDEKRALPKQCPMLPRQCQAAQLTQLVMVIASKPFIRTRSRMR